MTESTTNPRRRTYEFRQLVALVLQILDVQAQPRPEEKAHKLHERLQEPKEPSDILGVPGWLIHTHTAQNRDLSGALDEAQRAAQEAGAEHVATVWRRHRLPAQEAYVVMTLTQFGKVLHELQTARQLQDSKKIAEEE
jgi:hypothetical protein